MELPHEFTCKQWCSACTLFADEWAASVNRRVVSNVSCCMMKNGWMRTQEWYLHYWWHQLSLWWIQRGTTPRTDRREGIPLRAQASIRHAHAILIMNEWMNVILVTLSQKLLQGHWTKLSSNMALSVSEEMMQRTGESLDADRRKPATT